ncbi:hypothetical protein LIBO111022_12225 [Listeria booriae]|uniref:hypothetical protein n=1 Tax=Listeria booriae TaxID=1552123 RepID=UPI000E020342|nr:hypothetical protein [Listeria booriae]STY45959.1 Uncharacterised protein [Listeria booriae]
MQPYVLLVFVYATMIAVGFTTTTKQSGVAFKRPIPYDSRFDLFHVAKLAKRFDTGFYVVCTFVMIVFANFVITYFGTIGTIQDKKQCRYFRYLKILA